MPNDVVLDANVLAHSANPGDPHFESALAAIVAMLEANVDTLLALDDTGKNAPALEPVISIKSTANALRRDRLRVKCFVCLARLGELHSIGDPVKRSGESARDSFLEIMETRSC